MLCFDKLTEHNDEKLLKFFVLWDYIFKVFCLEFKAKIYIFKTTRLRNNLVPKYQFP